VHESETLRLVTAEQPDPSLRQPSAAGGQDLAAQRGLVPADPESDLASSGDGRPPPSSRPASRGRAARRRASDLPAILPNRGCPEPESAVEALDDPLHRLETLAGDLVEAVADADEARPKAAEDLLGAALARL
jgi:hypothetical protein